MWMMGYTGDEFNSINQDSFPKGHKLRPLIARPAANPPPCLTHIHMTTDLLTLNHHISMVEQNKFPRDHQLSGGQQVVVSSRWNPTPEQLRTLEELYRRGTRTPSADQIQHITAELRRYGKIEGKNVFYWFQNHKARERQKRRRQLKANSSDNSSSDRIVANGGKNESSPAGVNRTVLEVEETKNWAFPTNSSTVAERTVSPKAAAKAAAGPDAERKPADHGWLQFDFDDHQLQQQSSSQIMIRRNDTWQTMHWPCSSSSPTDLTIINSSTVNGTSMGLMPAANQLIKTQDFVDMNIFVGPADNSDVKNFRYCSAVHGGDDHDDGGAAGGELAQQTLQLFPLDRQLNDDLGKKEEHEESGAAMDHSTCSINAVTPHQFFEFLPLKN